MSFTRDDIKNFMKQMQEATDAELLVECGCEDEEYSVHDDGMHQTDFNSIDVHDQVRNLNGGDQARCPMSYGKTTEFAGESPHAILDALRPLMQQAGVGCPQSFAKALADVFDVTQDMGIVRPFNTEP